MEKMSQIAKNLDNFMGVVYTACSIAVCVLAVFMAVLPFAGEHMLEATETTAIELGCIAPTAIAHQGPHRKPTRRTGMCMGHSALPICGI